ncbi:MAG TPA: thiamine phosphate synthase [Gemmatimonadetes bacterium]|nr:thiamine phosphate synthase [Gemmatimonadota bacterium]
MKLADRLRLTVITDEVLARPRALSDVVREALAAGAPTVQLRLKSASARELLEAAQTLMPIVRSAGALFIVNDRLDVALAAGADGVHLGPDDPPVKDVRRVADARSGVADTFIVGYSTDTTDEAARAEAEGADYLGVGAVYATANKSDAGDVIGLKGLRRVVKAVSIPVVAIGGITPERAPAVAKTGACGSATIGAVMSATEPAEAVRELLLPFGGTP